MGIFFSFRRRIWIWPYLSMPASACRRLWVKNVTGEMPWLTKMRDATKTHILSWDLANGDFLDRGGETGKILKQGWILVSLKCFANSRENYETPDHRWFKWFGNHRTGYQWMNDTVISGIPSVLETRTPGLVDVTLRCGMSRCIRPDWLLRSPNPLQFEPNSYWRFLKKLPLVCQLRFPKCHTQKISTKNQKKKLRIILPFQQGRFPSFGHQGLNLSLASWSLGHSASGGGWWWWSVASVQRPQRRSPEKWWKK